MGAAGRPGWGRLVAAAAAAFVLAAFGTNPYLPLVLGAIAAVAVGCAVVPWALAAWALPVLVGAQLLGSLVAVRWGPPLRDGWAGSVEFAWIAAGLGAVVLAARWAVRRRRA